MSTNNFKSTRRPNGVHYVQCNDIPILTYAYSNIWKELLKKVLDDKIHEICKKVDANIDCNSKIPLGLYKLTLRYNLPIECINRQATKVRLMKISLTMLIIEPFVLNRCLDTCHFNFSWAYALPLCKDFIQQDAMS